MNKDSINSSNSQKLMLIPLVLIISLFFLWGMANNLNDILISQFKKAFQLTDFQSGLVQSAFYLGYFFFALPASMVLRKYNYKTGIIIGLLLFSLGAFLFYPAAQNATYGFFLFALFVIASGLAFLETAANPYVTILGSPQTAAFRLNLAQAFNPIGCITGILVGQYFIFSGVEHDEATLSQMSPSAIEAYYKSEIHAVETPYLVISTVALLFSILFALVKFPKIQEQKSGKKESLISSLSHLWKIKHFKLAVITQFFYMGAQVCIWSFMIRYAKFSINGISDFDAAHYLTFSLIALTVGRFAGTFFMKYIKPNKLLAIYAIINIVLVFIGISSPNLTGVWALVVSSFFMSIMYPTIFSLGLNQLGNETKTASSILVMAIVGGAILTAVMGFVSDITSISMAMIVPLVCFVLIALYGLYGYKVKNSIKL